MPDFANPVGLYAEARNLDCQPGTPTLVLMPFLGGTTHVWDEVRGLLGTQPTLALDLPGFGGSAGIPGYTVAEMADAVLQAIRAAGLGRFVLVGHSMAGKVSAVIARRMAGDARLAGLVLVAPSPPSPEPMGEEKRHRMLGLLGTRMHDDEARARSYVTKNEERDLPPEVEARTTREVLRMNRTAWVAWLEHGSREDWSEFVGVLELPALVVAGEKDSSLGPPQQREATLPHLAHARLVEVEGCSHLIPLERPERMAKLLLEFVAALPLQPTVPAEYLAFLASDRVSGPTRAVLEQRMAGPEPMVGVLTDAQMDTLKAALARIVPGTAIDLAGTIVARLGRGQGDGWRYGVLPPDLAAYRRQLDALGSFTERSPEEQDAALARLAESKGSAESRWFEDLRADAAEAWTAHPATMAELGFSGPGVGGAYTPQRGYVTLLANEREGWEPMPASDGGQR